VPVIAQMVLDHFMYRKITVQEAVKLSDFTGKYPFSTDKLWERMQSMGFDIANKRSMQHDLTLQNIDELLADKRLVFVTLNRLALDGKEGTGLNAVLILRKEGDDYIAHDPGPPSQPDRLIKATYLADAIDDAPRKTEIAGIKLANRPTRADVLLARAHPEFSRAALAKLFDKGLVTLKGKELKSGDKIMPDAPIEAVLETLQATTEDIDLPILYEDDDCIVINKPTGVLTHVQGEFNPEPTVASFLRQKSIELEDGERAGVVHRLDRPTSGVIIGAKNKRAMGWLQKQFAERAVAKTYVAVVKGHLKQDEAIIDMPIERNPKAPATHRVGINGREAQTHFKVLQTNQHFSLLELKPKTGRTHQLRVHLAHLNHPIVGDPLYGSGKYGDRLFLHARSLEITLPNGERKLFEAPIPPEFMERMQ
jgi:23S rRNA pseudouridine1911/1915/1917 synthase